MAKEDIFSKINLKDYNNILENILEQKDFSEDTKNLLLSMLYKIENGYQDYETVKINVSTKKYFLKKIVQIINEECKEIKLIKPLTQESKILEKQKLNYIVDKEKGTIIVYPNERMILEALIALDQKELILEDKYKMFEIGLSEVLTKGNQMSIVETIRDFNGWSWDITTSQMQSKNINLVYQNLLILLGNKFLKTWISDGEEIEVEDDIDIPNNEILRSKYNNSFGMTKEEMQENNKINYVEKMQELLVEKYGKKEAEDFVYQLIKTIIAIGCNRNKKQKDIILQEQNVAYKMLKKMQDNKKYLEDISRQKRQITDEINQIDKNLSDNALLKEEYERRNEKLENKDKIFSVSHLKIMLDKEREQKLEQIKKLNKKMEPKEFVSEKRQLEEKVKFFEDIGVEENKKVNEDKQILKLQKCFINCFNIKIQKAETKKEITNLIYELRYYEQIPYKESKISEEKLIENLLEKIEQELIDKACLEKILITFSNDKNLNKKILENQFQTKIINLENTIYILKYHKGILKIEIYDTNIEEEIKEIKILEKVELQVKLNKKLKIWE